MLQVSCVSCKKVFEIEDVIQWNVSIDKADNGETIWQMMFSMCPKCVIQNQPKINVKVIK